MMTIKSIPNVTSFSLVFLGSVFSGWFIWGHGIALYFWMSGLFGFIIFNLLSIKIRKLSPFLSVIFIMTHILFSYSIIWQYLYDAQDLFTMNKSIILLFLSLTALSVVLYSPLFLKDGEKILRVYKIVLAVSALVLIFQFLGNNFADLYLAFPWQRSSPLFYRPSGVFLEPAHMGQFSLGLLFFQRSDFFPKKNQGLILLVVISLVVSFSAISLIVALSILLRLVMGRTRIFKNSSLNLAISLGIVFLLAMGSHSFLSNVPQFERIQKASNLEGGSSIVRVLKGPILFQNLPLEKILLGVGPGLSDKAIDNYHGEHSDLFQKTGRYVNGFFDEFICYGFFAALFLNLFYLLLFLPSDDWALKYITFQAVRLGAGLTIASSLGLMVLCVLTLSKEEFGGKDIKHSALNH